MSEQTVWQVYEQRKAELQRQVLSEKEYQAAIKRLAVELGIWLWSVTEVLQFPAQQEPLKEVRVADCDNGYTRIANELFDEIIKTDLSWQRK